jgi:hypothetical protein
VTPYSSAEKQPYDFQLITTPMTWADAEKECVRRNRKLASIHSQKENDWVASLHHGADAKIYDGIWLGLSDSKDGSLSSWNWVDKSDFNWHNWGPQVRSMLCFFV